MSAKPKKLSKTKHHDYKQCKNLIKEIEAERDKLKDALKPFVDLLDSRDEEGYLLSDEDILKKVTYDMLLDTKQAFNNKT